MVLSGFAQVEEAAAFRGWNCNVIVAVCGGHGPARRDPVSRPHGFNDRQQGTRNNECDGEMHDSRLKLIWKVHHPPLCRESRICEVFLDKKFLNKQEFDGDALWAT
jgi:hypothetical protein